MGTPRTVTPFSVLYPEVTCVNLMDNYKTIGNYGKLAPIAHHHPMYSVFGITYTCTHTVVLSNLIADKDERRASAESFERVDITGKKLLEVKDRLSSKPMLTLLVLERYVYDMSFRRIVEEAAKHNILFDAYIPGNNGECKSGFYTFWYPEIVNSLVRTHSTKDLRKLLADKLPADKDWYLPFIYNSPKEFEDALELLVRDFYKLTHLPLLIR